MFASHREMGFAFLLFLLLLLLLSSPKIVAIA